MSNDPKKVWSNDPKVSDFPHLNADDVRRYELDLKAGRLSTNGTKEDHDAAMQALKAMREWEDEFAGIGENAPTAAELAAAKAAAAAPAQAPARAVRAAALTLTQLLDKFLALKKGVSQATITDYTATVKQFDEFAGKPMLADLTDQHVTDYMLWLAKLGNTERTIDKKVGTIRALFNFAKKHKLYDGENPAAERNLLTKKQRTEAGSRFYQLDDVKAIYDCPQFKAFKQTQPNFHLIAVAGLITGARVSALATMKPADLRESHNGFPYIRVRKDKTDAGARDIPVPRRFFEPLKAYLEERGDMGFKVRADGKGASDPVRKLLDAHLESVGLAHEGYTFHGLRKTLNNFLKEQEIDFEVRCQFVGHEFEHVNNTIYSRKKSLDEVAKHVLPAQEKLLDLIRFE
jgi:site-specific recombinase XerD